jgi:hypothetical protein
MIYPASRDGNSEYDFPLAAISAQKQSPRPFEQGAQCELAPGNHRLQPRGHYGGELEPPLTIFLFRSPEFIKM